MCNFQELKSDLLKELEEVIGKIDGSDINELIDLILDSGKVFVMGAGRTMLMCSAFAKRLSHLNVNAYVVGETVTPPIADGDLVIACSSSGETTTTVSISKLAKRYGGKIVVITSDKDSTLCKISDMSVCIPCGADSYTPAGRTGKANESIQPMGSFFEQAILVVFDCIAIMLKERMGIEEEEMRARHANLE